MKQLTFDNYYLRTDRLWMQVGNVHKICGLAWSYNMINLRALLQEFKLTYGLIASIKAFTARLSPVEP